MVKKIEKKVEAKLAKVEAKLSISSLRTSTMAALEGLAGALTNVVPSEFGNAWGFLKSMEEAIASMQAHMKQVIEGYVLEHGRDWGEKGGREVVFPDGPPLRMRLHRTGIDPRKLEKLLRARNMDPSKCMDAKVTFAANPEKVAGAVREGLLTEADVSSTYYDETWVVQR